MKKRLKKHVVKVAGMLTVTNPAYALIDNVIVGMPDDVCLKSRAIASGLSFLGLNWLYNKGRDKSRNYFHISDHSAEKLQWTHDALYLGAFNFVVVPLLYVLSGSRDWKEIVAATALQTGIGFVIGGPAGYSTDTFKELADVEPSKRIPERIRKANTSLKKIIAASLFAASIWSTLSIYKATPKDYQGVKSLFSLENKIYEH